MLMKDAWEFIFSELQKEDPLTVLFFIMHYYYGRSMKDLSAIFGIRADIISKMLSRVQNNIRTAYEEENETIDMLLEDMDEFVMDPSLKVTN